ncbi:hypothetical protein ACPB8Q_01420 [Methanocaldococcus indicus]|uniref:hypothetical protein n=1 Tax=Methanocaldococcus indicus TaxID=213231 RepID=UPI003C6D8A8E
MKEYINYLLIICILAILYTILVNIFQLSVIPALLSMIILFILAYLLNYKTFASKYKKLEAVCMFIVMLIFSYSLYRLFIPS